MWNSTNVCLGYLDYPLSKDAWDYQWAKKGNNIDLFDDCLKHLTAAVKQTKQKLDYEFKTEDNGNVQVFTQDLPGVQKEDVTLEIVDDQKLLLTAKRGGKEIALHVIPSQDYDVNTASAKLELGVLEIRFAKKVVTKKLIEVK